MNRELLKVAVAFTILCCCQSCSKTNDTAPAPHQKAVYAVGYHNKNGKSYTTLWKDGIAAVFDSSANPTDIYVTGTDVYVSGRKNSRGMYWKNGSPSQLVNDPAYSFVEASSIFVAGSDIHVAGFAQNGTTFRTQAFYWKNNTPVALNAGANAEDAYAQSVFVNGNDTYVAGYKTIIGGGNAVILWKNGVASEITSSATASFGNVCLYVSSNDVYVICYEYEAPNWEQIRVWKNNIPVSFPSAALGAVPYNLFVSGSDIFISGFEREGTPVNANSVAKCWKNGTSVISVNSANGSDIIRGLYVDGNDVYTAGTIGTTYALLTPAMWKNGNEYTLTGTGSNTIGEVIALFVH